MTPGALIRNAALLAVALLAVLSPVAGAEQVVTPSGLIQQVTVTQSSTEAGQPTSATIQTSLASADGSRPSATQQISISLPSGMIRNTGAFATCDRAALESLGPRGCPEGSRIGTGVAVGDIRPVVTDPINAIVTIFNAPGGDVLLYVFPDLGPVFVLQGHAVGASTLVFDIPPIPTLPSAPDASLRQLRLTFVGTYLVNPPSCPTTGWTWGFAFTYANGEQASLVATIPCTGPPPPADTNRSRACRAERERLGEVAFAARYGANANGRDAYGKCVSG